MSGLECKDCFLKFSTAEELANHKEKFCTESDWYDPLMMKASLQAEKDVEEGEKKALSFDEVRQYLKKRTRNAGDPLIGALALDDIKGGFKNSEKHLETLHMHIAKQRELEKAEELRQLKIKQQKMRAMKTQEEREVRDLMGELEKRKELELRQRMEKEMVKRELRSLDAVQMKQLEQDRRAEIAQLARERNALKNREDDLMGEVKKLESRMQEQELKFRKQQNAVDQYFEKTKAAGKASTKHEQMQLAQHRGQRAAQLKEQRMMLIRKQKELKERANKMNVDVLDTVSRVDVDMNPSATAVENEKRDELQQIVEEVEASLGAGHAKLTRMKADFKNDVRKQQEEHSIIEAQLGRLSHNPHASMDEKFSVKAGEILEDWVTNKQIEEDEDEIMKTVAIGAIYDELDRVVDKTDIKNTSMRPARSRSPNLNQTSNSRGLSPSPVRITNRNESSTSKRRSQPQSPTTPKVARTFDYDDGNNGNNNSNNYNDFNSSMNNRNNLNNSMNNLNNSMKNNNNNNNNNNQMYQELEALKRQYYSSNNRDPNILIQIQNMERQLNGMPNQMNGTNRGMYNSMNMGNPYMQQQQQQTPMQYSQMQQPQVGFGNTGGMMMPPPNMMGMMPPQMQPMQYGGGGGGNQMAMMMMMQQQAQQQQQQMQMQQLKQQEEENRRMQQEMEALMRMKDSSKVDYQRREFQKLMREMSNQVSALAHQPAPVIQQVGRPRVIQRERSLDTTGGGGETMSTTAVTEDALRALSMLPKDSDLYKIQMQHLAAVTKVKFEMEELSQKQRLFELKQDLEKKKSEHEKELEHDEFMAEKRRQLRAARIQRILAKEMPGTDSGLREFSYEYDPNLGFTIFFDFTLNVPKRFTKLKCVYCFAVLQEQKTKIRALPVADCEPDADGLHQCVVGISRDIKKVPPIKGSRCIIEIQAVSDIPGERSESVGWCAVDLFILDTDNQRKLILNAGMHKLPLQRGQVDFHLLDKQKLPTQKHISMFCKLCVAGDTEKFKNMSLDTVIAAPKYTYPSNILDVPKAPKRLPGREGRARGERESRRGPPRGRRGRQQSEVKSAKSPTVDSSKADLAKKRKEAEAKKAKAAAAAKKAKGKTKKDGDEDEEDEEKEKELPREWETGGIGLYIQGLENSYLGGEVENFKVKATIYDAGGNPAHVKSKELSFETERVEVNYDIKPEKEDGVFVFKTMEVFDDLGDLAVNDSVIVFEIIDEEDEKRCWTSTNIVYDDQVFNTIDKNPKQLKLYDYPENKNIVLPPSPDSRSENDKAAELVVKLYNPKKPPKIKTKKDPGDEAKKEEKVANAAEDKIPSQENQYFIANDRGPPPREPLFKKGDGFDIYIDSIRFLPAISTLSQIDVKVMDKTFDILKHKQNKNGEVKEEKSTTWFCDQSIDAYSPSGMNTRLEFRGEKFDNTLAICIRVDVVDEITQELRMIGYGYLNIFCQQGKKISPEDATHRAYVLNEGGHQIPLYYGKIRPNDAGKPWDQENLKQYPKIPCTTVLARIVKAPKDSDTNATLSIFDKDVTPEQHEEMGLFVAAPDYASQSYDSANCIPSDKDPDLGPTEHILYKNRFNEQDLQVRDRAKFARRPKVKDDEWNPDTMTDDLLDEWIKKRLTVKHSKKLIDARYFQHYLPETGLLFQILGAYNLKFASGFFGSGGGDPLKITYRIAAKSYNAKKGIDTFFTLSQDFKRPYKYPRYTDPRRLFKEKYDKSACMILELRQVELKKEKKGDLKLIMGNIGFCLLPIFRGSHKVNDEEFGFVNSGTYKLPIYTSKDYTKIGKVPAGLLKELADGDPQQVLKTDIKKKYKLKELDTGAHTFVQLVDKQLLSLKQEFFPDEKSSKNWSTEYLPVEASKIEYGHSGSAQADEAKKGKILKNTINKKLNMLPDEYEKKINILFAKETGIKSMGLEDEGAKKKGDKKDDGEDSKKDDKDNKNKG